MFLIADVEVVEVIDIQKEYFLLNAHLQYVQLAQDACTHISGLYMVLPYLLRKVEFFCFWIFIIYTIE